MSRACFHRGPSRAAARTQFCKLEVPIHARGARKALCLLRLIQKWPFPFHSRGDTVMACQPEAQRKFGEDTMPNQPKFATLAVHAGEGPCKVTGALDTPIYQSTTFVSADSDEMAAVYGEEKFGYMYTRYGNPTIRALEEKIAALEHGEAALAAATGMAAISTAILGFVKSGDHVVAARSLYGAAYNFLNKKLPRF